jgi:hypothetical protein
LVSGWNLSTYQFLKYWDQVWKEIYIRT